MSEIKVLSTFKKQLEKFFDELYEQVREPDLLAIRIFISNQMPIKDIMDIFNQKINNEILNLRKMVVERNEKFFIEHNLFDELGKTKVDHFKKLWLSGKLDEEGKKIIWSWVDLFVKLGDKYTQIMSMKQIQ